MKVQFGGLDHCLQGYKKSERHFMVLLVCALTSCKKNVVTNLKLEIRLFWIVKNSQ